MEKAVREGKISAIQFPIFSKQVLFILLELRSFHFEGLWHAFVMTLKTPHI